MFLFRKFSVSTKLRHQNDLTETMPHLWNNSNKKSYIANYQLYKDLHCQLCSQKITTSAIKCMTCNCYLHTKCFDKAAEIFVIQKHDWICKTCSEKDARNFEIQTLISQNECLKDQVKILTKLVSQQDYVNCMQKQKLQELKESVSILFNTVKC